MNLGGYEGGIIAAIVTIVGGLLGWRTFTKVRTDNARDNRESRHEENIQDRLDSALQEVRRLSDELREAKDGRGILERKFVEARRTNVILLEMLEKDQRESAERWVKASAFAPLEDPRRP